MTAPGCNTLKDDNNDGFADGVLQETHDDGSWSYWFFQRRSMATSHVSAAAAMLTTRATDAAFSRSTIAL